MSIIKLLTTILLFSLTSISFFPNFSKKKSPFKEFEQYRIKSKKIPINDPQLDIKYLQNDVIDNRVEIQKLNKQLDNLTIEFNIHKEKDKEIDFNCRDPKKGFATINTDGGILYVSVKEVKPYIDGYKINLSIGNPNLVTYINPEINLSWNISFQKFLENRKKAYERIENSKEQIKIPSWEDTLQKKSYCINKRFLPGIWNEIELHIPNTTIDQLEHCTLSITTGTVLLSTDNRID